MSRRVHARRRVCALSGRTFACERLEGRFLLSGVMWTGAGDGVNWTDAHNWSSSPALPGPADDVTIPASAGTIHLASGDQSVRSLTSAKALSLDGGSLAVATTATATASVTLNGGDLKGGSWTLEGGALMASTPADSTLEGVAITGMLDLSSHNGAELTVLGGLTIAGRIPIGNSEGTTSGRLIFGAIGSPAGSLSGPASVILGASPNNAIVNESNETGDAGTLTLAPDLIHGANGTISALFPDGSLKSETAIKADVRGALTISGRFVNAGSLVVGPGGMTVTELTGPAGNIQFVNVPTTTENGAGIVLDGNYTLGAMTVVPNAYLGLNGSWSCPSTITVNGGTLDLGGAFSVHPGEIVQTAPTPPSPAGNVNIKGTLNGDLTLDASTGSWTLSGGTIVGGTLTELQGAQLLYPASGTGTLNGVTVDGPVNLTPGQLTVVGALVLNGTMQIGGTIQGRPVEGRLTLGIPAAPGALLGGNGTVVLGGLNVATVIVPATSFGASGMLEVGPNLTIRGSGTVRGSLLNRGSITADVPGGMLNFGPVTNRGTMGAINGGELGFAGNSINYGMLFAKAGGQVGWGEGPLSDYGTMRFDTGGMLAGEGVLHDFSDHVVFADNAVPTINTLGDLNLYDTAVVDLGNNVLQIASFGQSPTIRSYLASAYHNGKWDRPGITSSDADATHGIALRDSYYDAVPGLPPNTIDLRLARVGDLNLDGKVDSADLLILAQHYGQAGDNWDQGDLNYDSSVNFSDLLLLAQNYGRGTTMASSDSMGLRRRASWRR